VLHPSDLPSPAVSAQRCCRAPRAGCWHSSGHRGARSLAGIVSQPLARAARGLRRPRCRRLSLPGAAAAGASRWQRGFTWGRAGYGLVLPDPAPLPIPSQSPRGRFAVWNYRRSCRNSGGKKLRYDKAPSFRDAGKQKVSQRTDRRTEPGRPFQRLRCGACSVR